VSYLKPAAEGSTNQNRTQDGLKGWILGRKTEEPHSRRPAPLMSYQADRNPNSLATDGWFRFAPPVQRV